VIHDHTLLGPFFAAGHPPMVTTNHGPFTPELREIYGAVATRVPIIAISRSQRAEAPELPIAAVIHHGVDPAAFPVGTGGGRRTGWWCQDVESIAWIGRTAGPPSKATSRAGEWCWSTSSPSASST
jgi:hypothetical protein